MATAPRATASNSNAGSTTITVVVPATAQAGDIALLSIGFNSSTVTATGPSGWSQQFGPDASPGTNSSYLYYKQLVSGDIGATVSITLTASTRWSAIMDVISGGTLTGLIAGHTVDGSGVVSDTIPTLPSVPSGAYMSVHTHRRVATGVSATTISLPSGYTSDGDTVTTANGSGANYTFNTFHKITSSAGNVGGETLTYSQTSAGTVYAIAIPSASSGGGNPAPSGQKAALFIGDSLTEGQGASTKAHRWLDLIVSGLRTFKGAPSGGMSFIPAWWNVYAPASTWGTFLATGTTGTWSSLNWAGPGYRATQLNSGASITYSITGTSLDIWYYQNTAANGIGTMTVTVDGTVKATQNCAGSTEANLRFHADMGTAGTHTVTVAASGGAVGLLGMTVYNGDETSGYQIIDASRTSIGSGQYRTPTALGSTGGGASTGGTSANYSEAIASYAGLGVDIVVVELGANDYLHNTATSAQLQSNIQNIITDLKAVLPAGVRYCVMAMPSAGLQVAPDAGQTEPWTNYRNAMLAAAANSGADVWDMDSANLSTSTDYAADNLHPNDSGHAKIATSVLSFLTTARTGKAKVWNGSTWVQHPVKRWSGTAWELHPAKGWTGFQWLIGK